VFGPAADAGSSRSATLTRSFSRVTPARNRDAETWCALHIDFEVLRSLLVRSGGGNRSTRSVTGEGVAS
jgi:hypothetical protein